MSRIRCWLVTAATLVSSLALSLASPSGADGQTVAWQDLVITGGLATEGYQGNLPTVSAVVRDSTEFASALIGEVGVRGALSGSTGHGERISLAFDGGLRQFSARGFELRDYSPREWAGRARLEVGYPLGEVGRVSTHLEARGRDVSDRPPMPLFLQPGHRTVSTGARTLLRDGWDHAWDLEVRGEWSDFLAPQFAPQIRLLDRRALALEAGVRPAFDLPGDFRIHAGADFARFPEQSTLDDADPHRRDQTFRIGASWTWQGDFLAQLAGEARRNRSNSRRPEYDAATARGLVVVSLPGDMSATGYMALTAKQYRFPTEFARLIPGEEANSASQAYVSLTRPFARNFDGTFRMGWTRAETEIGGQYFQRFGGSLLMSYRPHR